MVKRSLYDKKNNRNMKKVYLQPTTRICSSVSTLIITTSGGGNGVVGGGSNGSTDETGNEITVPDGELDLGAKNRFYDGL